MKIAILGNGKMGKIISSIAKNRGHEIVVTTSSKESIKYVDLKGVDVAIEFSTPESAFKNIVHAIQKGVPVVSGTTGWLNNMSKVKDLCLKKNGAFLYSSNFSIGMNIFFEANNLLTKLTKNKKYTIDINEVHHTEKLDTPSGTALKIKQNISKLIGVNAEITSKRIDGEFGTHIVHFDSDEDQIEIIHKAKNRDGFAKGAIYASEWIVGKKGVFSLSDVVKLADDV